MKQKEKYYKKNVQIFYIKYKLINKLLIFDKEFIYNYKFMNKFYL